MLWRRHIAQEEAAGKAEEGQGADAGIWECEHSAGGVYCGVADGGGIVTKSDGGRFERHRQPWTSDEIQKLHTLASKGMPLKLMAKALTRSEESIKDRAKVDGLKIAKLR
jgi:hypothetical protein